MENDKITFSISNDLIAAAIEKQLNACLSLGQTDQNTIIISIVQQILKAKTRYGSRYALSGDGETFFDQVLRNKLECVVSNTIESVLEKNSATLKTIIEKEITANLHNIANYLVDSTVNKDKSPIRVNVNMEISNFANGKNK